MLIRLIYASTATGSVDMTDLQQILSKAQTHNPSDDLTGVLAFNSKIFLQVLEGNRDKVNALYSRIMKDPRHNKVTMLSCKEIEVRHWSKWSMGFVAPNTANRELFLKYSESSTFNPYDMSAEAAEKMLMEAAQTMISMLPA